MHAGCGGGGEGTFSTKVRRFLSRSSSCPPALTRLDHPGFFAGSPLSAASRLTWNPSKGQRKMVFQNRLSVSMFAGVLQYYNKKSPSACGFLLGNRQLRVMWQPAGIINDVTTSGTKRAPCENVVKTSSYNSLQREHMAVVE